MTDPAIVKRLEFIAKQKADRARRISNESEIVGPNSNSTHLLQTAARYIQAAEENKPTE